MVERSSAMAAPAVAFWRLRRALVVLLLWLPLSAAPAFAQGEPTYLTSGELLRRALDTLFEQIGGKPKVSMIVVEPAIITVLTQGVEAPHQTDEWTISRFDYLWFDRDSISGPAPHRSEGAVPEIEGSFFDLSEINVAGLNDVIARAGAFAKLVDPPAVTSLQIARNVVLLPERSYGPVQWRIGLASGRETAIIYANAAGEVVGGDLSGTIRAQRLDLLAQDDWPADQAQAELAAAIGDRPIVHALIISSSSIGVSAEHPDQRNLMRDYSWDYSGVGQGLVDTPNFLAAGTGDFEPFSLNELRLSALPAIKAAARKAFASENCVITGLIARKPTDRTRLPVLTWRVELRDPGGETGHVDLTASGEVLITELPKSRWPKEDWFAR